MKTVDIKGKPYIEVNERIKHFREHYPEGRIITEIQSLKDGVCLMRADIYNGEICVATGHAYEKEGSTFINKTSYIENCETSAVGRALGLLGIGIDTSIASAEEVQNAIANQKTPSKMTASEKKKAYEDFKETIESQNLNFDDFTSFMGWDMTTDGGKKQAFTNMLKFLKDQEIFDRQIADFKTYLNQHQQELNMRA